MDLPWGRHRERHAIRSQSILTILLLVAPTGIAFGEHSGPYGQTMERDLVIVPLKDEASTYLGTLVGFTENIGQLADDNVRFYSSSEAGAVLFYDDHLSFIDNEEDGQSLSEEGSATLERSVTDIFFEEGDAEAVIGRDLRPGVTNYLIGRDSGDWVTGVRTYGRVTYLDVWDGIDLIYNIQNSRLKYDVLVRPGGDADDIRLRAEGHRSLSVTPDGALIIRTTLGEIWEKPPVAFTDGDPGNQVDCDFVQLGTSKYGFSVGDYDRTSPLVIDPLVNSTYLGGTGREHADSIALDGEGNVMVVGYTRSLDFPVTGGALNNITSGGAIAFVSVLDADLSQLLYSTYIGGNDWDYGCDVGVDPSGNIYVAGITTSTNFPVTNGAFQEDNAGGGDVFVSKISSDGTRLLYSTLIGGSAKDYASYLPAVSLVIDDVGAAYLSGSTASFNFPTTAGSTNTSLAGGEDAYICKLHPSGGSLVFSTYLGGTSYEYSYDLAVSDTGVSFICGATGSMDLPTTFGTYQEDHTGDWMDIFVCALSSDGTYLEYLTYVGSWGNDDARSIAVDGNGAVYVHGFTSGPDFPTTTGAFQETPPGNGDTVLFKIDPDGEELEYSTHLGGTNYEEGGDIAIDHLGNAYVSGRTGSTDFPTTPGCDQKVLKGSYDAYVSVLSSELDELKFSTYLGVAGLDAPTGLAFDGNASLYVCGMTGSIGFPTTDDAYQRTFGGDYDGFITRYLLDVIDPVADAGPDIIIDQHETVGFNGSSSWDNLGIAKFSWSFNYRGNEAVLGGASPSFTFDDAGHYVVNLTIEDLVGNIAWDLMNVTVMDITPPVAVAGLNVTITQYNTVVFDGSGSSDNVGLTGWKWAFQYSGTEVTLIGPAPSFLFQNAGIYEVTLNVTDLAGNWAQDYIIVTVVDITAPVADAGRDLRIDQHETVDFDGTGSHDNIAVANWTWTFIYGGENIILIGPDPTFTFDIPGDYDIGLRVRDDEGNWDEDGIVVEVTDTERPIAAAGEDLTIDQDQTIVFDGASSSDNVGIVSFEWSFDYDNTTIRLAGSGPNFFFHTAGTYTVMLVVNDETGNWASDFVTVTVMDVTVPMADAGMDKVVDQHQVVIFDGSGSWDNSGIIRWTWEFSYKDTVFTLGGVKPSFLFDEAGDYEVILTVSDMYENEDSDVLSVTVIDITPPVPVPGEDQTVPQHTTVELNGTGSSDNIGIEQWEWSLVQGGAKVTLPGEIQSFIFTIPGSYQVTLTVVDEAGNVARADMTVVVRDTTPPVATALEDRTVDAGTRESFDGSASTDNVMITSYEWTIEFEGSSSPDMLVGEVIVYSFDRSGEYEITLTVSDAEGNVDTQTFTVTAEGGISMVLVLAIVIIVVLVATVLLLKMKKGGEEQSP